MSAPRDELHRQKQELRRQARAARDAQPDQDALSRAILERLLALPEFQAARTVLFYVDLRSEVRTREYLAGERSGSQRIVVPYCERGALRLFHLEAFDELSPGAYGILEPKEELRRPEKRVDVAEVDLAVVPGLAFDCRGGRLGHGRGYYDKLLARVRADALCVGLAYECQIFPRIPTADHDVLLQRVVTENGVYAAKPAEMTEPQRLFPENS